MKIDLINPSERGILENAGDRVPIGLLSLTSQMQRLGNDVKVVDLNHTSEEQYLAEFNLRNPDAVGISVYCSPVYDEAVNLAKKLQGQTKLIAGGYHATAMPETLTPYFDSIVTGEGELGLPYAVHTNGIFHANPVGLDRIPKPARHMLDMDNYQMQQNGKRTGTLITSRGCPYDCAFCGKLSSNVRFEPVDKVLDEINDLRGAGFESLYFLDDCFTLDKDRMKEITFKAEMPYRVTTRANLLDRDKVFWLAGTGCDTISMGFESGNNEILKGINKHMTTDDYRKAVEMCTNHNINTKGFFIIGLPGETEKTARETIDFAQEMKGLGLTDADFYALMPFPGTAIWNDPESFGITIEDRDFTKYNQVGLEKIFHRTEELSSERINELLKEARSEWLR